MDHRVLIVASAEGFIIKGIETKLQGIGLEYRYSSFKMKDLEVSFTKAGLVIVYADDSISTSAEGLVYIKDQCSEKDGHVIVIGTKQEFDIVRKYIPDGFIYKFYERPLEMETLITDVEKYMEKGAEENRKKSILIVDDDVTYMSMITEWLKDKYRVYMANSGMQAITWLAKNHADLILLDYEMPITPGPQVFEMIRSDASTADIPVMFLTGKSDKESIMKVLSLKPVGYVLKNVDRKSLRENIASYFAREITNSK